MDEGCLSCPGVLVRIQRQSQVLVEGQTVNGQRVSYTCDRVLAHCIQHEVDHLDGRLILDYGLARTEPALATDDARGGAKTSTNVIRNFLDSLL